MDLITEGKTTEKFVLFSGSDTNINTINVALNISRFTDNFEEWKNTKS